ncbi:DUF3265 domain-containing protein [Vibrio parahaemolyticus]|nr:DUF3265 domain-containing protein [Vibrio parahaemolyticus]
MSHEPDIGSVSDCLVSKKICSVDSRKWRNINHITNCSRGIRNAWHFYYALNLVIKVVFGNISIASLTP